MPNDMLTPEQLTDMRYSNAIENWPYYDTLLISQLVGQPNFERYARAGFLTSYNALGVQGNVPFFKLRNRGSVGLPYCNMDVVDRFNLPFHAYGIAVAFIAPTLGTSGDPNVQAQSAYFSAELPKHCGFTFQVGQDEKLASHAGFLNAGSGLFGSYHELSSTQASGSYKTQNYASGRPNKFNIYPFAQVDDETGNKIPTPVQIPRNETVYCNLIISQEGRDLLQSLNGPLINNGETGVCYQRALIRVTLYGVREVQLRNLQHY